MRQNKQGRSVLLTFMTAVDIFLNIKIKSVYGILSCQTLFMSLYLDIFLYFIAAPQLSPLSSSILTLLLSPPSCPSLFLHPYLSSSDGPVVGQCDRDVGRPHGQHHSAWEEEAVVAGSAFPPTIWQQVRNIYHSFMCRWGFERARSGRHPPCQHSWHEGK